MLPLFFSFNLLPFKIDVRECLFTDSKTAIVINLNSFKNIDKPTNYTKTTHTISDTRFEAIISDDTEMGGAINADSSHLSIKKCLFSANQGSNGAGCFIKSSRVECFLTNFSKNTAEMSGGAAFLMNAEFFLDFCFIAECRSNNDAGAIFADESNMIITNCNFYQNEAENDCGGIYMFDSVLNCKLVFFTQNSCKTSLVGAAIEATNSSVGLNQCSFEQNNANSVLHPIDGSNGTIFTIKDSCIGIDSKNLTFSHDDVSLSTDGVYFLQECNSIDAEIPNALEEIPIKFRISSSFLTIGFVISLLGVVVLPIGISISIPHVFTN